MSTTYAQVLKEVAATLNAIDASTAAAIDTQYVAGITNSNLVADLNVTFAQDTILGCEAQIITAICLNPNHPERKDFLTTTTLANAANIPATVSSVPVIGPVGAVTDSGVPLKDVGALFGEEVALGRIASYNRNANSMYSGLTSVYEYVISGGSIYHTRSGSVTVELATFALGSFSGSIRIRDWHKPALVSGVVARLLREDQWPAQQQAHLNIFAAHLQAIAGVGIDRQASSAVQPSNN